MRYAIIFPTVAIALLVQIWLYGGLCWVLIWPALSFLLVGVAYAGAGPGLFGKRKSGAIAWWSWLLNGPFLAISWMTWWVWARITREPRATQITAALWFGARPFLRDVPSGVRLIVDLTAEFPEPATLINGRDYFVRPCLDHIPVDEPTIRAAMERVIAGPGPAYVHCAQGHERSATVVAALLVRTGVARDAAAAVDIIQAARPSIRITPLQQAIIDKVCSGGR